MKLQTVLNVFALGLLSIVSTQAEVSSVSASPNPLRQGNNLTIRATVDRPGLIHFFFKGRPFGNPVYATGPGIYSTRAFVEANNVPAGKQCKECAVGAKQGKHTENAWIQVCR